MKDLMKSKYIFLAGLGWGDEGKGAVTDFICANRAVSAVVRYNGGHNATHRVVAKGKEHLFSQFGSGTFSDVLTYLSEHVVVNPAAFNAESEALRQPSVYVSSKALVSTFFHKITNTIREIKDRKGSTGVGFGETIRWANEFPNIVPRFGDDKLTDEFKELAVKLMKEASDGYMDSFLSHAAANEWMDYVLKNENAEFRRMKSYAMWSARLPLGSLLFEGAQGVLLDQTHGIGATDHATWSDCTFGNAVKLVDDPHNTFRLGVIRTTATRHGDGPFPAPPLYSSVKIKPETEHNTYNTAQGEFRRGMWTPEVLAHAAQTIGPLDGLAVTHCDELCDGTLRVLEEIFNAPIVIRGWGPDRVSYSYVS